MRRTSLFPSPAILALVVFSMFAASVTALAQDKAKKIDELMSAYHSNGQFNGTVLVAEKGNVIYKKGFGLANMEWGIANEPDTKFRLGSITKQFTSMLIMQMVEQGKINLESKLTDYLPDYRKDTGDKVTIHHLLTHTSGIPSYTGLPRFFQDVSRNPYSVNDFIKMYCSGDLEFEPGSKFSYNNSGYFLLGAIIEKLSGKPYEKVLQEKIFDPLGMKDTGFDHSEALIKKRAAGYEKSPAGIINAPYLDMSIPYAAGSLYSTVEDLYIWDQALYSDKLLSAKYKEMMFKPFLQHYAYGLVNQQQALGDTKEAVASISHGGGINGFNTLIVRLVADKHLIVLLNNTGGTRLDEMSKNIAAILYDKPYSQPKRSVADALARTIKEKDIAAAVSQYRELKTSQANAFDFSERELNQLGYQMLMTNRVKEAIEVFKLNAEAYPQSSNTYDSLGEAYMKSGDRELAIKNYKKSLELDPKNTNAVEMLKKLNAN